MVAVATDLKDLLSIPKKSRIDSLSDQYNRIFMVKLLLICTIIMGFSWYTDSINCIVPDSHGIDGGFVSAACWIQGVYVYKELRHLVNKVAYFGMPKNMDFEGMVKGTEDLCNLKPKLGQPKNPDCNPMTKTFFLQYQYMPFFIATLAILYYLPYIAFRSLNKDKMMLKEAIKSEDKSAEKIVEHHFRNFNSDEKKKSVRQGEARAMTVRVILNIIIKILYIVSNVVAFLALDNILYGEFIGYGTAYIKWTRLDASMQYDYMGMRDHPKPGNLLLPPFGYCEMYESARDVKTTLANSHKFVCELSQNILYQYCLIVLWFGIVGGVVISVIGLIHLLLFYIIDLVGLRKRELRGNKVFKKLCFREFEYLDFIKQKDVALYGDVMTMLKKSEYDTPSPPENPGYYPNLNKAGL